MHTHVAVTEVHAADLHPPPYIYYLNRAREEKLHQKLMHIPPELYSFFPYSSQGLYQGLYIVRMLTMHSYYQASQQNQTCPDFLVLAGGYCWLSKCLRQNPPSPMDPKKVEPLWNVPNLILVNLLHWKESLLNGKMNIIIFVALDLVLSGIDMQLPADYKCRNGGRGAWPRLLIT